MQTRCTSGVYSYYGKCSRQPGGLEALLAVQPQPSRPPKIQGETDSEALRAEIRGSRTGCRPSVGSRWLINPSSDECRVGLLTVERRKWLARLSPAQVGSLTQWDWLMDALCVAAI